MKLDIIATLGPASKKEDIIIKIIDGVSALRLNASHLTTKELEKTLIKLSKIFLITEKTIPVIIDLKGAKIRIGNYPSTDSIPKIIKIINKDSSDDKSIIPLKNKLFFDSIKKDMKLYLNDAKIVLEVKNITNDEITCDVLQNGSLSSNKGINIKNHPILYKEVTKIDSEMIKIGNKFDFTQFAFSFVYNGEEAKILKKLTSKRLIAKIEREESLNYLENIDNNFDDLWLCRGDLGAQVGLKNLGKVQYEFINKIDSLNSDVFLAGEVFYHMTYSEMATRTEIAQLYMLQKEGFKGFVLSDETAIGSNPVKVIEFLNSL